MTVAQLPGAGLPDSSRAGLTAAFVASAAALTSFFGLLSVAPIYVAKLDGGTIAVAATTAALMIASVIGELAAPSCALRFGIRRTISAGLALLAFPSLAMTATGSPAVVTALCTVRGIGFGLVAVLGSSTVASLVPRERINQIMGTYGIVTGIPAIIALPAGVWLARTVGYQPVFSAATIAAVIGLAAAQRLPSRVNQVTTATRPIGLRAAARRRELTRPMLVFFAAAVASGAVVTFLPIAAGTGHGSTVVIALFVHNAVATTARWRIGASHLRRPHRHLTAATLASTLGVLALVAATNSVAQVAGMALFGIGFGIAENVTITLMYQRVPDVDYPTVSALWNSAYDSGLGAGAVAFGLIAALATYAIAFAATASIVACAYIAIRRDQPSKNRQPSALHETEHHLTRKELTPCAT